MMKSLHLVVFSTLTLGLLWGCSGDGKATDNKQSNKENQSKRSRNATSDFLEKEGFDFEKGHKKLIDFSKGRWKKHPLFASHLFPSPIVFAECNNDTCKNFDKSGNLVSTDDLGDLCCYDSSLGSALVFGRGRCEGFFINENHLYLRDLWVREKKRPLGDAYVLTPEDLKGRWKSLNRCSSILIYDGNTISLPFNRKNPNGEFYRGIELLSYSTFLYFDNSSKKPGMQAEIIFPLSKKRIFAFGNFWEKDNGESPEAWQKKCDAFKKMTKSMKKNSLEHYQKKVRILDKKDIKPGQYEPYERNEELEEKEIKELQGGEVPPLPRVPERINPDDNRKR